jgi:hypothetical protein
MLAEHSDEDAPPIRNETPLEPVSEEFKRLLTDCKRTIYKAVIFQYPEDTQEAQDIHLLNTYLRSLSALYKIMDSIPNVRVDTIDWTKEPWSGIPEQAHDIVKETIVWYTNFVLRNKSIDRQPYRDYISNVFKHPFHQQVNPGED